MTPKTPDQAAPWYAHGLKFACTSCGNCCSGGPGYVWISQREIERLAEFLRIRPDEVMERYCRKIGDRWSLSEIRSTGGNYDCVFLTTCPLPKTAGAGQVVQPTRICAVYPVRPLQCRTWPFWEGNLAGPESWRRAGGRCPGMDCGKRYSRSEIDALRDAEDWPAPTQTPGKEK